jgi:hypothetical protein
MMKKNDEPPMKIIDNTKIPWIEEALDDHTTPTSFSMLLPRWDINWETLLEITPLPPPDRCPTKPSP